MLSERNKGIMKVYLAAEFMRGEDSPRKRYQYWYRLFRLSGTTSSDLGGSSARRNAYLTYWRKWERLTGWTDKFACQDYCKLYWTKTGKVHAHDEIPF